MLEPLNALFSSFNGADFHWLRPQALWLLLALPLIALLLFKKRGDNTEWQKVCDPELLPYVVESHNHEDKKLSWLWPLLLGLPAIIALAGPVWERVPQPVFDETAALVILLDTSLSMDAEDIKPNRMQRAKLKVLDILQQRTTGQTALIAFAAEPFVVSPLTTDAKTVSALVPSLSTDIMPQQGSNVSRAIEKAVDLLNNAGARGNILLLSDGAQGQDLSTAINTAKQAQARISVIGIGSRNGSPIPTSGGFIKDKKGNIVVVKQEVNSLRKLASQGHGSYSNMTANDADILKTLSNSTPIENQLQSTELQADQWLEQGPWLLLPVLLLASLLFRRGVLCVALISPLLFGSLVYSPSSQASEPQESPSWQWRDLFRNSEQQAAARFQQQQFDDSAQRFVDPQWKASAQYRAEDYAGAVETLSGIDAAEAHYNRGNALAKLGKTADAIAAYQSTLRHDAEHADALHNKELLEQQQEQEGEKSDEPEDSDQENQDQENSGGQQSNQEPSDQQEPEDQQDQNQDQDQQQQNTEQQEGEEGEEGEQSEEQEDAQSEEQQEAQQQAKDEQDKQELEKQYEDQSQQEVEQATQQWLRRIPDKPGNLLRNQFENESRRRQQANPNQHSEDRPW